MVPIGPRRSATCDFRHDQVPVRVELLQRFAEIPEKPLSLDRIMRAGAQRFQTQLLVTDTLLSLGDVTVRFGEMSLFHFHAAPSQTGRH